MKLIESANNEVQIIVQDGDSIKIINEQNPHEFIVVKNSNKKIDIDGLTIKELKERSIEKKEIQNLDQILEQRKER